MRYAIRVPVVLPVDPTVGWEHRLLRALSRGRETGGARNVAGCLSQHYQHTKDYYYSLTGSYCSNSFPPTPPVQLPQDTVDCQLCRGRYLGRCVCVVFYWLSANQRSLLLRYL